MISPLELLRQANKIFPETRIVWAALAVVAALAIIDSFRIGWTVAALGAVFVLLLAVLFSIVSGVCTYLANPSKGNSVLQYPAIVLVWTFTLGICAFVGLTISCFFIGKPKSLIELFTLQNPIVVTERNSATVGPLEVSSLPATVAPGPANVGGTPQTNIATVSQCLNAIDPRQLSVAEVQQRARGCLRQQ
jgi:hypothetical protein